MAICMASLPDFSGDLRTVTHTFLVDMRQELHVPAWCQERHHYEGNSWKVTVALGAGVFLSARLGVLKGWRCLGQLFAALVYGT